MFRRCALFAAFCLSFASAATASTMKVVIYDFSTAATNSTQTAGFNGATHTGRLTFSGTGDVDSILLDGNDITPSGLTSAGVSGFLDLSGGIVSGGSLSLTSGGQSVSLAVSPSNSANIVGPVATTFGIDGGFDSGSFTGSTFDGADISLMNGHPLTGSFGIAFRPNASGVDNASEISVTLQTVVPEPMSFGIAAGVAGILLLRRR